MNGGRGGAGRLVEFTGLAFLLKGWLFFVEGFGGGWFLGALGCGFYLMERVLHFGCFLGGCCFM